MFQSGQQTQTNYKLNIVPNEEQIYAQLKTFKFWKGTLVNLA